MENGNEKMPGFLLYPEDIEILEDTLSGGEAFEVLRAVSQFVAGDAPDENGMEKSVRVAYRMIKRRVSNELSHYQEKVETCKVSAKKKYSKKKTAQNANAQENSANGCDRMRSDAFGCERMRSQVTVEETVNETVTPTVSVKESVTETAAAAEAEEKEKENAAAAAAEEVPVRILKEYGMTVNPVSTKAVGEDIRQFGEEKVRRALSEAQLADSRGGISIRYYRAFLRDRPAKSNLELRPKDPILRHEYSKEDFDRMSIDLDEEELTF